MRLARLIGVAPAKRLCLLGRRFTAAEGATLGLVAEVVSPPDQLEQHALAVAEELLAIPFTALRHTKRQIAHAFDADSDAEMLQKLVAAQDDCLRSPEHAAVMAAYRAARGERDANAAGDTSP
jgi:enoyl-CoA hydratase/carnithine racemase